jgi:UDP-3-O-[3-hydroxymyristoyl] glucosamine N-acyltransferase
LKASEIARAVDGRLEGGSDPDITGAAPLDHAGPSDVTMLSSPRYAKEAGTTAGGAVLVTRDLASALPAGPVRIIVDSVPRALATLLPVLYPQTRPAPGVHPTAIVEPGTAFGADVTVGPYAVIGAGSRLGARAVVGAHVAIGRLCRIGDDAYLHPHVTLYDGVSLGDRSIVQSGARLGVDGFGYASGPTGHVKLLHVGNCQIGDDVEIGANTTIDRGSIGPTVIGNGTKIDNLVQVGHNVRTGEHCIVVSQAGISGSTRLGRFVTLGGQAGIQGHARIGDGATVAAQAGVFGDVEPGITVSGYPARPHKVALRAQASLFRLPELMKRLRALEDAVTSIHRPGK